MKNAKVQLKVNRRGKQQRAFISRIDRGGKQQRTLISGIDRGGKQQRTLISGIDRGGKQQRTLILKLDEDNLDKEIEFELNFLKFLTIKERFQMMFQKTREMLDLLEKSGHRRPSQIIKRTRGGG